MQLATERQQIVLIAAGAMQHHQRRLRPALGGHELMRELLKQRHRSPLLLQSGTGRRTRFRASGPRARDRWVGTAPWLATTEQGGRGRAASVPAVPHLRSTAQSPAEPSVIATVRHRGVIALEVIALKLSAGRSDV